MTILIDTSGSMVNHIGTLCETITLLGRLGHGPLYKHVYRGYEDTTIEEITDPDYPFDMTPDDFHGDSDLAAALRELFDETSDRIILITDGMLTKPDEFLDLYNSTSRDIFIVRLDEYDADVMGEIPRSDRACVY